MWFLILCSVLPQQKISMKNIRGYLVLNMTPTNMFVNEAKKQRKCFVEFPEMQLATSMRM